MAEPPFPVPMGMEWDPERKRFFKSTSKVSSIVKEKRKDRVQVRKESGKKKAQSIDHSKLLDKLSLRKKLQDNSSVVLSNAYSDDISHLIRSNLPRFSHTKTIQRLLASDKLGRAKHVRTASTDIIESLRYSRNRRLLGIHSLCTSEDHPSLLYFMSWNGFVYSIDISQMNAKGTSEVDLHLSELSWSSRQMDYQIQTPLSPTTLSFRSTMVDRMLIYAPNETPNCYGLEGDCFAFFTSPQELKVYKFDSGSTNFDNGRKLKVSQEKCRIKIPKNWPSGGYVTLSMRRFHLTNCLIVCVGIGNRVCSYRLQIPGEGQSQSLNRQGHPQMKLFRRVESDVISHDISPSGRFSIVGCRNGRLAKIALEFETPSIPQANESLSTKVMENEYLPYNGIGAVTNIKFVSEFEILLAYSNGGLITVSLDQPQTPLRVFEGHVNSWTLNPPLALDTQFRLVALAGQDRKVRIWNLDCSQPLGERYDKSSDNDLVMEEVMKENLSSFDQHNPYELKSTASTKTIGKEQYLQRTVFPNDITGLTFCQRFTIANDEARQNTEFIEKNLPALAVSCGGSEIAFFE